MGIIGIKQSTRKASDSFVEFNPQFVLRSIRRFGWQKEIKMKTIRNTTLILRNTTIILLFVTLALLLLFGASSSEAANTATVSRAAPPLGPNDRVNMGVNETLTFEIVSSQSTNIKGYQWQVQFQGIDVDSGAWEPTNPNTDTTRSYSFSSAGARVIYARMVNSNDEGSTPIAIPVTVWELPVIASTASDGSGVMGDSWFTDTYVGFVGQVIKFDATVTDSDLVATFNTPDYLYRKSKFGSASARFEGDNEVVVTNRTIDLANQSFTIAAWIKRDEIDVEQWAISQGTSSANQGLHFGYNNSNKFTLGFWSSNGLSTSDTYTGTSWEHWVATYNADTNTITLYRNGVFEKSGTTSADYQGSGSLYIGSRFDGKYLNGRVDDVAIFNRVINSDEIATLADTLTGALTGREDGLIYYNPFDFDGPNSHKVSRYRWLDSTGNVLFEQRAGHADNYTWDTPNLDGSIKVKAITNDGIEGETRTFPLKVYPELVPGTDGPFVGKPNSPVTLSALVDEEEFPGATFSYQWFVQTDPDDAQSLVPLGASNEPETDYTWANVGLDGAETLSAQVNVTVTTAEGATDTQSASTTVILDAETPIAEPGGPYQGGIAGGNFSPIELTGNTPGVIDDVDVGAIDAWHWTRPLNETGLMFDGTGDRVEIANSPLINTNGPYPSRTIALFFKTDTSPVNDPQVLWEEGGTTQGFNIHIDGGEVVVGAWGGGGTAGGGWETWLRTSITSETWAHVALVLREATSTLEVDKLELWLDGTLIQKGDAAEMANHTGGIRIGATDNTRFSDGSWVATDSGSHHFTGSIDEVALYNRPLSADEIEILRTESALAISDTSNWVAYWPFDEGTGSSTTADLSGNGHTGTLGGDPTWLDVGMPIELLAETPGWYNPGAEFTEAGDHVVSLRVQSQYGKWSPLAGTDVTTIDGKIEGKVRAADLRTPVEDVTITLTSSHVDGTALSLVASSHENIDTVSGGGLTTTTDEEGNYSFPNLPLGSYTLIASKTETDDTIHEFETVKQVTEITLDAPNQLAIDYTDLSVFPVGGQIYYSILKNGEKITVADVEVSAQPLGNASAIDALDSIKALDAKNQNYSMPLFAGKYLFKARLDGHEVRLVGTEPSEGTAIGTTPSGYDSATKLVTIENARTDIDFVDYTTRLITVIVEDSGEFPIETYQDNPIEVSISGTNGQAEGTVALNGDQQTVFTATVPPGEYTIELPNVPTAIVKEDSSQKVAEVDVTGGDDSVTMVVPVPIELTIGPAPTLLDVSGEFVEALQEAGIVLNDNPEGFMFFYPPEPRTHTYTVTATANGNPVSDFTLLVTDEISQITDDPPEEITLLIEGDGGGYKITAGKPKLDRSVTPPIAASKTAKFVAQKDGYLDSDMNTQSVTILGFSAVGEASQIVSVPVVNYLVLHDPPGDKSYAFFEDSMTISGVISDMTISANDGTEIPIYPAPWSVERSIDGVTFDATENPSDRPFQDLGDKGLLGYKDSDDAVDGFSVAAAAEIIYGGISVGLSSTAFGIPGYILQAVEYGATAGLMGAEVLPIVQYSVRPSRLLKTPAGDKLPDLMGSGKGDIYYGEGWTLGLQLQYLLAIEKVGEEWVPRTEERMTYDILERSNQYLYTIRDIENLIIDLGKAIDETTDEDEKTKLENAKSTWEQLLTDNLAYQWQQNILLEEGQLTFEQFRDQNGLDADDSGNVETLIFSAGPSFKYSRAITQAKHVSFSTKVSAASSGFLMGFGDTFAGADIFGTGSTTHFRIGANASLSTAQSLSQGAKSGQEVKQTIGFVLQDDDIGDNIATRVYADQQWGTPLFFTDDGSVTSDPWEPGTNKAVDVTLELIDEPTSAGPFDYHDGAHYRVQCSYAGLRELDSASVAFSLVAPPVPNQGNVTVRFNGQSGPYTVKLSKSSPVATVTVDVSPPQIDMDNAFETEYPVAIKLEEQNDSQIKRSLTLSPTFADLRSPHATVTAPYDGQRISPTLFTTEGFEVEVFCDDEDVAQVQIQIRTKQPDGVYEPWQNLSGMLWEDGGANTNVTVVTHTERDPQRSEFTFDWAASDISSLGVGEYQLRAASQDAATHLDTDGSQTAMPNVDLDAPVITFRVDDSEPTVLTTVPFYQDSESERIYRAELSVTFTDDMRADDFNDRSFEVEDLLNSAERVSGFVSYSPTLRKAVFVPVQPFIPNGFYRATIKTDSDTGEVDGDGEPIIDRGLHDLAGNPLDQDFSWTFRTTDSPFEETWSIVLSATDSNSTDANNIASIEYGAEDGEDERDARALPALTQMLELSFIDSNGAEFDRDTRPADGRLAHHWFFAVENPTVSVTLRWKPSTKLVQSRNLRQYKDVRLVEFTDDGSGNLTQTNTITPEPSDAKDGDGLPTEVDIYTYTPDIDETVRYFRLDVMKASFIVTAFNAGTSGWSFFSVPIIPEVADPFVNLGDDIEPFQLFSYDTPTSGYKVYPLDLGEVSLRTGHGYFTRLTEDIEVDIGGAKNLNDVNITLDDAGWHAIGNPFILPVKVTDLLIDGVNFTASADVESVLYRWILGGNVSFKTMANGDTTRDALNSGTVPQELIDAFSDNGLPLVSPQVTVVVSGESWEIEDEDANYEITYNGSLFKVTQKSDFYRAVDVSTDVNAELAPWGGYWLKTLTSNLTLTIPAPEGISSAQLPLTEGLTPPLAPEFPEVLATSATTSGVFDLKLAVTADFASDLTTMLGTRPDASEAKDSFDMSEPPALNQTVSVYFNHAEWGEDTTKFNTDYQSPLEVGETRTWEFVVFTDKPKAEMTLSYKGIIEDVPEDIMLSFRRKGKVEDTGFSERSSEKGVKGEEEWSDMRLVKSVEITSETRVTRIPFEVRAERFEMAPPDEVKVVFDEGQVEIRWRASDNPFITGYTITRTTAKGQKQTFSLEANADTFVDTDVIEEQTYTYQLTVGFKSGAKLHSELITVTVRPLIKETVLLQNYPNPFNPETWIPYELAKDANVSVDIYNAVGQRIRSLDLGFQPRGRYTKREKAAYWDGRNNVGERIASGVYFYVFSSGHYTATRKMVIVK